MMTDKNMTTQKASRRPAKTKHPGIWPTMWNCLWPSREIADKASWHIILAQSMVIFALAGAIAAGAAAVAEQEAQRLERLLTWGHHLAFIYRQELLADASTRAALEVLAKSYNKQGKEYLKAANQPGAEQQELERQAQEDFAAARTLRPFLAVLPNPFINNLSVEQSLQKKVAFYMARQGFETHWTEPPKPAAGQKEAGPAASSNIWENLDQKLEEAHSMVRFLALGVVFFVAALGIPDAGQCFEPSTNPP